MQESFEATSASVWRGRAFDSILSDMKGAAEPSAAWVGFDGGVQPRRAFVEPSQCGRTLSRRFLEARLRRAGRTFDGPV
jgi:hypothetical protein